MPLQKLRALTSKAITLRSSLIRAVVFALTWAFLPWWLFIPIALSIYFVPLSEAKITIAPFLILLVLCLTHPAGWFFTVIFGLLFWYILLIKDLYIIDRKSAYEILALTLIFLLLRVFYLAMDGRAGMLVVLYAFVVAGLFSGLMSGFMGRFSSINVAEPDATSPQKPLHRTIVVVAFLLFFQLLITGLFLPLDFIYQSVVVFLFVTLIFELFPLYFFGNFSRTKLLATASVVFALLVLVLGSARWQL
jgi:hypothetical protein